MFNTIVTRLERDLRDRIFRVLQKDLGVVEPDLRQILMWRRLHDRFEYSAEVKQADATMFGELLKPDVLIEIR